MAAILIRDLIVKKRVLGLSYLLLLDLVVNPSLRNLVKEGAMVAKEFIKE